jgi:hypothetical protein
MISKDVKFAIFGDVKDYLYYRNYGAERGSALIV